MNTTRATWEEVIAGLTGNRLAIYDDLERIGRATVHDPEALDWLCRHHLVRWTPQGATCVGIGEARRKLEEGQAATPEAVRPAPVPTSQLRTPPVQMAPLREKSGQLSFFGA